MKYNDVFPGKYLKAGDVSETGDVFVIERCEMEEIGQGNDKQIKPVLYFEDEEKGLVLNKTNFKTIVEITGQGDSDDWEGQSITLFTTEVQFGADMVESIRVKKKVKRSPNTKSAAAVATPAPAKSAKPVTEPTKEVEVMDATEPTPAVEDDDEPPF